MFTVSSENVFAKLFRPWDAEKERELEKSKSENSKRIFEQRNCDVKEQLLLKMVDKQIENKNVKNSEIKAKRNSEKLRKIRSQWKNGLGVKESNLNQDSTISTTTTDVLTGTTTIENGYSNKQIAEQSSPIKNERLHTKYQADEDKRRNLNSKLNDGKRNDARNQKVESMPSSPNFLIPKTHGFNQTYADLMMNSPELVQQYAMEGYQHPLGYPQDFLTQAEMMQSLGLPITDPHLMESFAQGYAMELEYARILQQENEAKLLNARKQRPKKYRCPHCDVGFSNNGQLKGHIRIHTGERPFKCDDKACGKTFTRNEELTRHRRIHSGLRPYPCQTCGKKFGRRDHLKKHTRTHMVQAERMMPLFVPMAAMGNLNAYPYLYGY